MRTKEEIERVRLSNKCNDYGNSFTRKNFFKLTFDSYVDIIQIINSLFESENYELAYQVMDQEMFCLWDMFPEWQPTKKTAEIFDVSEKTLREWKKQGHIRHNIELTEEIHWRIRKNKLEWCVAAITTKSYENKRKGLFVKEEDSKFKWPYSERGKKIKEKTDKEALTKDVERYLNLYASYALKDS
tara:strand:+ start:62 stop:619 length:558 start_codon:yes stop_codon:yes gene_type:complete